MDWTERMTAALEYIEDNLADTIDYSEAARLACCSPFYFQRLFMVITGMTMAEYVRRRRLTLAATELSSGMVKVIDVAVKYGYDSPDAFTRAFRSLHGVTPQAAREPGTKLAACPRISFHIELKGGTDMDYRIIDKPAFQVAIISKQFSNINGQNFKEIPAWWAQFLKSPDCAALTAVSGSKPGAVTGGYMLGVCWGEEKTGDFYYGIAVELPEGASPGKFGKMTIPATTWAIFDCNLASFQETSNRIFRDWYQSTGYDHPGTPDLEVYLQQGAGVDPDCQIWAPVIKK